MGGALGWWFLDYSLFKGVSIYGKGGLGLIYMTTHVESLNTSLFTGQNQTLHLRILVPENDINLGLKYSERLFDGNLSAKVAWYNLSYINALPGQGYYSWSGVSFGLNWLGNA